MYLQMIYAKTNMYHNRSEHRTRTNIRSNFRIAHICDLHHIIMKYTIKRYDARGLESIQNRAHNALLAFLSIVRRDENLRAIFWQVVRLPSLWSIVTYLGVKMRLAPKFHDAQVTEVSLGGEVAPAWNLPVQILGNAQRGLVEDPPRCGENQGTDRGVLCSSRWGWRGW